MHPIGAHEQVGPDFAAVLELNRDTVGRVLEPGAAGTEVDRGRIDLGGEQLLQFGPVRGGHGRPHRSSRISLRWYTSHLPSGRLRPPPVYPPAIRSTSSARPIDSRARKALAHKPTPAPTSPSSGACS